MDQVLVFIPSYGDWKALPRLAAEVEALGSHYVVLILDDGSPHAIQPPARCLFMRMAANFGLGICTEIAFLHAATHGYRALVRIDADGQHDVADVPRLLAELENGADLAVGLRVNQPVEWTTLGVGRWLVKAYLSLIARTLTLGRAPVDICSGLFAINQTTIAALRDSKFERYPEPELYVSAARAGARIASVMVHQHSRAVGRSTLGATSALRLLFRFNVFALGQFFRRPWF